MAKNKPADNQFTVGEKYLARIITARWCSLPTVGVNEAGLAIQVKLSILCSAPTNDIPVFCGLEAVIYVLVAVNPSNSKELRISSAARDFLDAFGIPQLQYPNRGPSLPHNSAGIICEFGPADPVNRYQSILVWEPVTDTISQHLVTMAIKTGTSPLVITGLEFPEELVATRFGGKPVHLHSLRDWHALKLLVERTQRSVNRYYNGQQLCEDACKLSGAKRVPESLRATTDQLIHRLKPVAIALKLELKSVGSGNYILKDLARNQVPSRSIKTSRQRS